MIGRVVVIVVPVLVIVIFVVVLVVLVNFDSVIVFSNFEIVRDVEFVEELRSACDFSGLCCCCCW